MEIYLNQLLKRKVYVVVENEYEGFREAETTVKCAFSNYDSACAYKEHLEADDDDRFDDIIEYEIREIFLYEPYQIESAGRR